MAALTEPLPGTADLWEPEVLEWTGVEEAARAVFSLYGYGEVRTPVFERTDVFVRAIGDETDVVQKEMYTFQDRGGRSLTLRPEGTAGVIRAIAHRGLSPGEQVRVYYLGPMFRGERPAAGRRRQFHQVGVESVGSCLPQDDAEAIAMLVHYLEVIGIRGGRVLLNSRGLPEDRGPVGAALRRHFQPHLDALCADCRRRFETNVWRMLDCKEPACREIAERAPAMVDLLGTESRAFFAAVLGALDDLGVAYEIAPRLVRGLDYYVHTVFEVVHSGLGAQDALAGGGRYRISLPGGKTPVDGVGFAAGVERLLMARESLGVRQPPQPGADAYIVALGNEAVGAALILARDLRRATPGFRVLADYSARSMKAQMRTANRIGVPFTLILGETELAEGKVTCRDMRGAEQHTVSRDAVVAWLRQRR
ncbi:MAG: histidine--tRNA ligase [Lentisphaeria bacterium]|nr:histidine--tRNA ligase [Lentisphaeria bacterium]